MSQLLPIGPRTQVTLHFSIQVADGEVVDSTFDKSPATFCYGDGSLLPGFETAIEGLVAGTEESLLVPAERAFGAPNPKNVHGFRRDQLPADVEPEPGLMMVFTDPGGHEIPGVVESVQESGVRVDFNHPLAGRDILFRVQILDVHPLMQDD